MTTTIQIEDDTWKILNERKNRGETFDSVIKKALLKIPSLPQTSDKNIIQTIKQEVKK